MADEDPHVIAGVAHGAETTAVPVEYSATGKICNICGGPC